MLDQMANNVSPNGTTFLNQNQDQGKILEEFGNNFEVTNEVSSSGVPTSSSGLINNSQWVASNCCTIQQTLERSF
jgi:hypothetical protein